MELGLGRIQTHLKLDSFSCYCEYGNNKFGCESILWYNMEPFEYMPSSGITGLYSSGIFTFLRHSHTDFHNGYVNVYAHKQ